MRKPKIWNIAILSLVIVVLLSYLTTREHIAIPAVILVICGYLAVVIVFLLRALFGQLKYNPYSYNTIYYTGFALFLLSVLIVEKHVFRPAELCENLYAAFRSVSNPVFRGPVPVQSFAYPT